MPSSEASHSWCELMERLISQAVYRVKTERIRKADIGNGGLYGLIKQCVSLAALQKELRGGTGKQCLDVPPLPLNSLESLPFPL